jgi:predicted Zn-dependent protease
LQKTDLALAFATDARRQHPSLPNAKYLTARMLDSLGRSAEALPILEEAVAEEPKNEHAANHLVRLLAAQDKTTELDARIEKLLAANPDNQFLLGVLAELYAGGNEIAKAQALLTRLKDVERHATLISYLKAAIAASKRDYQSAEKLLAAASANPTGHLPSTLLLARVRLEQNRKQDALAFASQVRRQRPSLEAGQVLYARLLDELGRTAEAEAAARDYLTAQPKSRSMRLALAQILVRKDPEAGRSQARRLVEAVAAEGRLSPVELEACVLTLIRARHADDAKALIERAAGASNDPWLLLAGGRSYLLLDDATNAQKLAERSLALDAGNTSARLLKADALVRQSDQRPSSLESAVELYREVLKLQPGQSAAANNLAWVLGTRMKKPHRALEELQTALPISRSPHPDLPAELLDTIGTLHLLANHPAEAQRFLESAAVREPNSAAIQFHLGQTYRQLRRSAQARVCFEKVVELDRQGEWIKQIPRDSLQAN